MRNDSPDGAAPSLLAQAESGVCDAVFVAGVPAPRAERVRSAESGAEAVRGAAAAGRGAAILGAGELLGALQAVADAAAARVPIVVHVLPARGDRAPSPGRDELAPALEVGAGVIVSWSARDAADLALGARRAAEDSETPFVHVYDGPWDAAGVQPIEAAVALEFLGAGQGGRERGPTDGMAQAVARKRAERGYAARVPFALGSALRELSELTGRVVAPIERFESADADEVLVAVGAAFAPAVATARALRGEGRRVGVVGLRALRPFFAPEVVKAVARARAVVVLEPLDVALAPSGPAALALKAAFADAITWAPGFPGVGRIPPIVSAGFATTSDGAIAPRDVRAALDEISAGDRARRVVVFGTAE
jgi:pyruvate ferredoxin oxidoreductase alpha subunit